MRECWVNCYVEGGGGRYATREDAQIANGERRGGIPLNAPYRIHVKLKPDGAPKRYMDEVDRALCECGDIGFAERRRNFHAALQVGRMPQT